ncbi:nuclear transcription factor Y subunit B-3-like [Carya illinoinensis]|uniref:nuclear transcription factor Y subunit B-3-like n=1 Tax=Carya illinoinensis TaxID=32201 RepID=UPI001C727923|nr:nuclear transcription factor Y subunit B-3-like [Carya illinoinensis]
MKKARPANVKILKDAKEMVQECVSEFISFITGEASNKCEREKRNTIKGDDLLWAMTTLGFEDYMEPLKVYLEREGGFKRGKVGGRGGRDDMGETKFTKVLQSGLDHIRAREGRGCANDGEGSKARTTGSKIYGLGRTQIYFGRVAVHNNFLLFNPNMVTSF